MRRRSSKTRAAVGISVAPASGAGATTILRSTTVGARFAVVSNRFYQGDESNELAAVPGFFLRSAETGYRFGERLRFRVENLLDRRYTTAGVLSDADAVFPEIEDPRFATPGRPRTFEASLALAF